MNKQSRTQLTREAKEAFQRYQAAITIDRKKDQADERVVEYASEIIKELPGNLMKPEVEVLESGVIVLTWLVQNDLEYNIAALYINDRGYMHLCMNCGEFAGHILAWTVDHLHETMEALIARLEPYFFKNHSPK